MSGPPDDDAGGPPRRGPSGTTASDDAGGPSGPVIGVPEHRLNQLRADIARLEQAPPLEVDPAKRSRQRDGGSTSVSGRGRTRGFASRGHASSPTPTEPGEPPSSQELRAQAYQRGMALLVRREHSRKELGRKLGQRGLPREEVDEALADLKRVDFQNDERFACALARSRAMGGQGPVRIRAELGTHGLDREAIDQAMEAVDVDFRASAQSLLERRFSPQKLKDPTQRRKAVDFLLRRGFEQRLVYGLVKAGGDDDDVEV